MKKGKNEGIVKDSVFLTVEQAFDNALGAIKDKSKESERGKIYVWKQRFKEGNLSHKKIATILENAGFHKVVEERWMPIDLRSKKIQAPPPAPEKKPERKRHAPEKKLKKRKRKVVEEAFPA
jgi:hypothetical protein